jgi:hypothetical protein
MIAVANIAVNGDISIQTPVIAYATKAAMMPAPSAAVISDVINRYPCLPEGPCASRTGLYCRRKFVLNN